MPRTKQTAYNPALRPAPKIRPPATGLDGSIKDEPRTQNTKKPWTTCAAWWEHGRPYLVQITFPSKQDFSHVWWARTSRASGEAFQTFCQWLVLVSDKYDPQSEWWEFVFEFDKAGPVAHSFVWNQLNRPDVSEDWKNWGDVWTCVTSHLADGERVEARVIPLDEMVLMGDRGSRSLERSSKRSRGQEPEVDSGAGQSEAEESKTKRHKVE